MPDLTMLNAEALWPLYLSCKEILREVEVGDPNTLKDPDNKFMRYLVSALEMAESKHKEFNQYHLWQTVKQEVDLNTRLASIVFGSSVTR